MTAAGSCTISYSETRTVRSVTWSWTSDGSGDVSGGAGLTTRPISGEILRIVTNPGATAPSDNWDAVINDADGADVATGLLANRDTANTEQVVPVLETLVGSNPYGHRVVVDSALELVVSNAGDSKQGAVTLYYR